MEGTGAVSAHQWRHLTSHGRLTLSPSPLDTAPRRILHLLDACLAASAWWVRRHLPVLCPLQSPFACPASGVLFPRLLGCSPGTSVPASSPPAPGKAGLRLSVDGTEGGTGTPTLLPPEKRNKAQESGVSQPQTSSHGYSRGHGCTWPGGTRCAMCTEAGVRTAGLRGRRYGPQSRRCTPFS